MSPERILMRVWSVDTRKNHQNLLPRTLKKRKHLCLQTPHPIPLKQMLPTSGYPGDSLSFQELKNDDEVAECNWTIVRSSAWWIWRSRRRNFSLGLSHSLNFWTILPSILWRSVPTLRYLSRTKRGPTRFSESAAHEHRCCWCRGCARVHNDARSVEEQMADQIVRWRLIALRERRLLAWLPK